MERYENTQPTPPIANYRGIRLVVILFVIGVVGGVVFCRFVSAPEVTKKPAKQSGREEQRRQLEERFQKLRDRQKEIWRKASEIWDEKAREEYKNKELEEVVKGLDKLLHDFYLFENPGISFEEWQEKLDLEVRDLLEKCIGPNRGLSE
jgi:hypothetical protein